MYCQSCGKQMNDTATRCVRCGASAGIGNGFCIICGFPKNMKKAYCVNCGAVNMLSEKSTSEIKREKKEVQTLKNTKRLFGVLTLLGLLACIFFFWRIDTSVEPDTDKGDQTLFILQTRQGPVKIQSNLYGEQSSLLGLDSEWTDYYMQNRRYLNYMIISFVVALVSFICWVIARGYYKRHLRRNC